MISRDLQLLRKWAAHRAETAPERERALWSQIANEVDRFEDGQLGGPGAPVLAGADQQSLFTRPDSTEATP